jgi:outer membrane lipase/esterase
MFRTRRFLLIGLKEVFMSWNLRVGHCCASVCLALMGASAQAGPYSSLYVFGDSLSDVGNDLVVTGGAVPSPGYYTDGGNTGRFTNGLNYIDRLAAGLGVSATPSVLGGTNYAFGGARIDTVAAGLPPTALSFNQQIGGYLAGGVADPGALYVLWIGANDMSDLIAEAATAADPTTIPGLINARVGAVMGSIAGALSGLAGLGAQHFLVPNLPDLSLVPEVRGVNNPLLSALAGSVSAGFNQALAGTLGLNMFSVLDIRSLDVFAAQTQMTLDPAAYGLSNVSDACYSGDLGGTGTPTVCANPDEYLYWDFEHPTAVLHAQLGQLALAAVPEPASWSLILLGLGLMGGLGRRRSGR